MACRRRDRRNLTGCNIGDVGVRGCGRGCCPYDDSRIFQETHLTLSTSPHFPATEAYAPSAEESTAQASRGRTNLRFNQCGSQDYRPKFICVNAQCQHRRLFKPYIDEARFEYRIDRTGWYVRPRWQETPLLQTALRRGGIWAVSSTAERERLNGLIKRLEQTEGERGAWGRGLELWSRIAGTEKVSDSDDQEQDPVILTPASSICLDQAEPLTTADLMEILEHEPELWWQTVAEHSLRHYKRCPGCGADGVRVGSNFRVPARDDHQAWKKLIGSHDAGTDLRAAFEYCPSVDSYNEMIEEANRLRRRNLLANEWEGEKEARLRNLGLSRDQQV